MSDDDSPPGLDDGDDVQQEDAAGTSQQNGAASLLEESGAKAKRKTKKVRRSGVIYLSSVPYHMTASRLREYLSVYGEIGRIYLSAESHRTAGGKRQRRYTEGWIEFGDKSVAKRVAASFNNTLVGGRKKSKAAEALWNMKYLSRFKWSHLQQQLDYERALHAQRMRTETAAARRSAGFFAKQIDKGKQLRKLEEAVLKKGGNWDRYQRHVQQRKAANAKEKAGDDVMHMIFAE